MKRIWIAGAFALAAGGQTLAADLPQPGPPPPRAPAAYVPVIAPVYNWGGIYIGVNGGYGFASSSWTDPFNAAGSTGSFSPNGYVVGGTIGANYQAGQFVIGVEADLDYAGISGSSTSGFCTNATGGNCQTQDNWLGTARLRGGYAFDRVLLYATGGAAFGNVQAGLTNGAGFDTNTEIGWAAGGGVEVAFTENLTGKIEYLFVDLSNGSCSTIANCGTDAGAAPTDTVKFTANLVRAGLNFKFGGF